MFSAVKLACDTKSFNVKLVNVLLLIILLLSCAVKPIMLFIPLKSRVSILLKLISPFYIVMLILLSFKSTIAFKQALKTALLISVVF